MARSELDRCIMHQVHTSEKDKGLKILLTIMHQVHTNEKDKGLKILLT
jgi:hypothetical protein